jgi:uncharacterized membrane-anchored protein
LANLLREVKKTGLTISGKARCDKKTKRLISRLLPGEIAVIDHADIDDVAAAGLIEAKVLAVINLSPSMTGRYQNRGPLRLLRAGIPVIDVKDARLMEKIREGQLLSITDGRIYANGRMIAEGEILTFEKVMQRADDAKKNAPGELLRFFENTLHYADKEKQFFLGEIPRLPLQTKMQGRHVLVVVRGLNYREDLRAIMAYIREVQPVLIGVDGGADALLQFGLRPHLIVGDMDSVSDAALLSAAEIVVHAYPDGHAPGLTRVRQLGREAQVYPAPGTSEDIAMLLAYECGADLIVAVGTHSHMVDFLEKGRKGMASTLLTRLRVGPILVDAKGVSQLYQKRRLSWIALFAVCTASMIPVAMIAAVNPMARNILRMFYWHVRLWFV